MERPIFDGELTAKRSGRVQFALATERDDAEIRRLLRENPMAGSVALSLEREPNFFADAHALSEEKQTIVAREAGQIVCVGTCAIRSRFVNGEACRVGYLGGLRLDKSVAGRFDILRRGYGFFREIQADRLADFYFTSIAAGNERARRFLERGLSGMPRYEFVGEVVSLVLSASQRCRERRYREASTPSLDEISEWLNQRGRHGQFAPCWSSDELTALEDLGLATSDFEVVRRCGRIIGCAALWDQRAFKQVVVRGYVSYLRWLRPIINLGARITGQPRWPAPGTAVAQAFISHLAVADDQPDVLAALVEALIHRAAQRRINMVTLAFGVGDPRLVVLRNRFPCREYRSRIYLVRWSETTGMAADLRCTSLAPEVALL